MIQVKELRDHVKEAVAWLEKQPGVKAAEAYASANRLHVLRLCYASNVPSNGIEEPKSLEGHGVSVRVHFADGRMGFGKEDNALGREAVTAAFAKAKRNAVRDADFQSLPEPRQAAPAKAWADARIVKLEEDNAVDAGYALLNASLATLEESGFHGDANVTGEIDYSLTRMAVASSQGIAAEEENTSAMATVTCIVEGKRDASAQAFDGSNRFDSIALEKTGREAAEMALTSRNPATIESGDYKVVFSRLAIAELLYSRFEILLPQLESKATPFLDKMGKQVYDEKLSIEDNACLASMNACNWTDEGLPAGKTQIIDRGILVAFLGSDYYAKKFASMKLEPRNGFRGAMERSHAREPYVSPTNLVVAAGDFTEEELVKETRNGLYIGRLWYTYPVNGYAVSDFSSTVRGNAFVIREGEIAEALAPNTCRIMDNLERVWGKVIGLSREQRAAQSWGQDAAVVAPEIAVESLKIQRIATGLS